MVAKETKPDAIIRTATGFFVRYQGVMSGTRSNSKQRAIDHLARLRAGAVQAKPRTINYPSPEDF